ncbi:preprotein translocase subunit SecG [Isosphaeraceae bacterium EP7]
MLGFLIGLFNTLSIVTSVFLICLVLIQRGKGGGLAGAFGGVGGSSAFGTKAGDVFTRVTIVVAAIWISLYLLLNMLSHRGESSAWEDDVPAASSSTSKTTPLGTAPPATGTSPLGPGAVPPAGTSTAPAPGSSSTLPPALPEVNAAPKGSSPAATKPTGPISATPPGPVSPSTPAPAPTIPSPSPVPVTP